MEDKFLTGRLDQKLLTVLMDVFRNSIIPNHPSLVTVEVFLCGIYERYPEEIKVLFTDPSRFNELVRKFYPLHMRDFAHFPPEEFADLMKQKRRANLKVPADADHGVQGMDIRLEPWLAAALRKAGQLAAEAGVEKAGIADFVEAFSLNDELVDRLSKETGLVPRNRAEPESSE